jgi:opacity protein-like surface antigen
LRGCEAFGNILLSGFFSFLLENPPKASKMKSVRAVNFILLLAVGVLGFSPSAYSESYIGFGMGASIPKDFSRVKIRGATKASYSNVTTHNSFAYELKAGHFWDSLKWQGFKFGLELNYLRRDLDATTQVVDSDFVNTENLGFRNKSFQTLSLIPLVRYEFEKFAPYFGVGLAVNLLDAEEISLGNTTINTVKVDQGLSDIFNVGMMVSAGLNYKISENLKIYSEYKYSQSNFNLFLDRGTNTTFNLEVDAVDHNIVVGLVYGFDLGKL